MSALHIQGLSCSYQKSSVLKDLNLTLHDNEIVCLLGESGCGKTTLLKAVAGLQNELSGLIKIRNKVMNDSVVNLPPENRKIGLIFQDYALFPHLNVFDNVAFSLTDKLSKQEKQQRVNEVLNLVQLADMTSRFPHQLSGGQQQRIAIARALAYQPNLMLLDEPFSNLDQHVRFQLIADIRGLLKSRKMSALFVTHSKEEGFAFADKIALMKTGKIVQFDTPQVLYRQPCSAYVADFMGQTNYIDVDVIEAHHYSCAFGVLKSESDLSHQVGTKRRLLLRPEHLTVALNPEGEGMIQQVDFQGALQQVVVRALEQDFIVKHSEFEEGLILKVGDRVSLNVLNHHFITFDGE